MREVSAPGDSKKSWNLSASAFRRLMVWLDQGPDSEGHNYLVMRARLVAYFDRKNCPAPEELADATLNRVARRLEEEGNIDTETAAKYCYIVARFVFMEYLRDRQKTDSAQAEIGWRLSHDNLRVSVDEDSETKEKLLHCLDLCAEKLQPSNRELIFRYYVGKERAKIENRRSLAEELGITINALAIRACRIRDQLEGCVRHCVGS